MTSISPPRLPTTLRLADQLVTLALKIDVEVRVAVAEDSPLSQATALRLIELRAAADSLITEAT